MSEISWSTMLVLVLTAVVSPFSLIAFSLVLATDRGPKNGVWFILGWIVTVFAICAVSIAIGGAADVSSNSTTGDVTLGIQIALGAVLLMLWVRRKLRNRLGVPDPLALDVADTAEVEAAAAAPDKPEPAWRRRIATMKAPGAFVMGGATQTWPVMIAGGAEIAHASGVSTTEQLLLGLAFALATTIGIVILEVLAWRNPASAPERLRKIEDYVSTHRDNVVTWIMLFGGIWLLGRGIYGVVSG